AHHGLGRPRREVQPALQELRQQVSPLLRKPRFGGAFVMSGAFAAVKARDVSWQAVRMGDVDAAELARLRAKAYGAGAEGLTDAEASRLRTLEDRARDRPAPEEVAAGLDDRVAAVDAPGREPHPVAD